jgi:DNA-binding NtrC family response regulator
VTRVLVVDDEVQVTRSIARVLGRHGIDVRTAHSAAEAMLLLEGIDVLLTDVRMSGASGIELIAQVKRTHPAVRCFLMSGDTSVAAMEPGTSFIDGSICKPFSNAALVELVRSAAREPDGESKP